MDKGLTVPKRVLIVWPKLPQMPQSAQFVCPSTNGLDFNEKKLHWASAVRGFPYSATAITYLTAKIASLN